MCAIVAGGGIMCWGYNGDGQLGIGSTTDQTRPVMTGGRGTGCGPGGVGRVCVLVDCRVVEVFTHCTMCAPTYTPGGVFVGGDVRCARVSCDCYVCCVCCLWVVCPGGWGLGGAGSHGTRPRAGPSPAPDPSHTHTPPPFHPGISASAISAGFLHTCAIVAGDGVMCWGSNSYGQLGIGNGGRGGMLRALWRGRRACARAAAGLVGGPPICRVVVEVF
jgi:hypothetical protein